MGLSKLFKTDERIETDGVVLDYGDTRIRIARAGGANKKYVKLLEKMTRPIRRALANGAVDDDRANDILKAAFAKTVILGWQTKVNGEWITGIDPKDLGMEGTALQLANPDNYLKVFMAPGMNDLFIDIREQAETSALFKADIDEAAAGN
jgi:hypothetical protein